MPEIDLVSLKSRYGIVGTDPAFLEALRMAVRVAPTDYPVLIIGETGAGKENIARIIHDFSKRSRAPYQTINCGSSPEGTIDSELFGSQKGAYTGSVEDRQGLFEVANKGTLFLDELGNMPLYTQVRLLRVLESGTFTRVGDNAARSTDVRVVAATNADLSSQMRMGKFRSDLYYRLNTVTIYLPGLRERKDDIYPLFLHFSQQAAQKYRVEQIRLDEEAVKMLESYSWPGNIRQLKHFAERLSIMEIERTIKAEVVQKYLDLETKPVYSVSVYSADNTEQQQYNHDALQRQIQNLQIEVTNLKQIVYELIVHNAKSGYTAPTPTNHSLQLPPPAESVPVVDSESVEVTDDDHEMHISDDSLAAQQKRSIIATLEKNAGSRKLTAKELGISERTLYRKIKEYGLE